MGANVKIYLEWRDRKKLNSNIQDWNIKCQKSGTNLSDKRYKDIF